MRRLLLLAAFAAAATFLFPALADETADPFSDDWKKEHEPEDDSWKSIKQELIFNNGSEPETLDPAIMTGVTEHTLALALFEGLCSHDPETLQPRPGVAKRWDVSADGKTYTFQLRGNAKWSNGEAVTSEDFRWSWYRVMTHIKADYSYLMKDYIAGGREFFSNHIETMKATKKPASYETFQKTVKVSTPDPQTLVVELENPTTYFLDLVTFETYMPVHRATVERWGDQWTRAEHFVGNGAFTLAEWSPRKRIVMVPSPNFWDAGFVKLKKITALPYDDGDVVYKKFINGEVHWTKSVPTAKLDDAKKRAEYYVAPYLGSYFYRFNTTREHLKDKRVRKALSLAVNRETITKDVTKAGQTPAPWFCPAIALAKYVPPKGFAYDPDQARDLMKAAGYHAGPGGKKFPKLTVFYNTSEDHKKVAERIAQMWRENLGIDVSLRNSEWKVYLQTVNNLDYDVARAGWIGDYSDPMTFLDMWVKDGGNNNTGWSSPKYDALIKQAQAEQDLAKRAKILQEAEKIVVEDEFPILPLYMYVNQGMRVDGLMGWYENVRDLHPFRYMYFEPDE